MRGAAGDFDSVTWPGYVGVLTASAPGRRRLHQPSSDAAAYSAALVTTL